MAVLAVCLVCLIDRLCEESSDLAVDVGLLDAERVGFLLKKA